ncbi:SDR family NAD(P)-dependent oxidoreductase [Streptomyces diastatochromogenes]|uniref:SDR family NAD(P)-dependent oxidoreductase n=1 Tax=Streptomyces diastatochromogenes TaxID=42236 RepID=UPI002F26B6AC
MSRPMPDQSCDVAVIGLSLRFPGSDTLAGLFRELRAGRSLISEVPERRWPKERWFGDPRGGAEKTRSVWAGFIDDAECFDAAFFNISPREAATMDPQQRLTLELAWKAIEDAGYPESALAGTNTGVFMGVSHSDYAEMMERDGAKIDAYLPTGTDFAIVANRVSYHFDLHGPSVINDTACASSLVSVHQAVAALHGGECDMALAGGVNLIWSPKLFVAFSQAGMLSPTGRSHAFDKGADGFVRGEGGAMLLLKPLHRAVEDRDPVHAVIKATGTNHGGRTNSLTVTNPAAQADLIEGVYTRAGIPVGSVGYIEAHGPGTPVGDPIEVLGLKKAFDRLHAAEGTRPVPGTCGLGSVKTNIGHLEAAAGVAGIAKVIGALATRTLPATVNFTQPNRLIDLDGSPFYVVRDTQPWQAPGTAPNGGELPRRAGVSSFGFGGANAHCLLEEHLADDPPAGTPDGRVEVFPLSARTEDRLRAVARQLLAHLAASADGDAASLQPRQALADIAYTLQIGREAMQVRRVITATSHARLAEALETLLRDDPAASDAPADGGTDAAATAPDEDPAVLLAVAREWQAGEAVDWEAGRQRAGYPQARRVRLPTYPFERVPHWYVIPEERRATAVGSRDEPHPLVHRNTSVLGRQRFTSVFTGAEPFLEAHRVNGARVLPAAAYVEMVREAVGRAVQPDGHGQRAAVTLKDMTWLRPLTVGDEPVTVHVELSRNEDGAVAFEVRQGATAGSPDTVHSRGTAEARVPAEAPAALDLEALRAASAPVPVPELYAQLRRQGLKYGPAMRGLREIRHGAHGVLARITVPGGPAPHDGLVLPPSVLDAAFQASVALMRAEAPEPPDAAVMPFVLERIEITGPSPAETWAWVRRAGSSGTVDKFDIDLADGEGRVTARVRGLVQRPGAPLPAASDGSHVVAAVTGWTPVPLPEGTSEPDAGTVVHAYLAGAPDSAATGFARLPAVARTKAAEGVEAVTDTVFGALGAVLNSRPRQDHRFVVLVDDRVPRHFHAPLTGLFRTVALENPAVRGRVVRVAGLDVADAELLRRVVRDEAADAVADAEVRYTADGVRHVRRTLPATVVEGPSTPPLKDDGVYWVTGGLGGLGRHIARYFARHDGVTVVLSGRSASGSDTEAALRTLRDEGVDAHSLPVDVTSAQDVERAVSAIMRAHGSLDGVVHAAGVLRDGFALRKSHEDLHTVLGPKVRGTLHLDAATRDCDLDFFVLFSSVAGVFGNPGQSDYAAANAFLDAFAGHRQALVEAGERTGTTLAVSWPLWAEGGMRVDDPTRASMRERHGWEPLPTEAGVRALGHALTHGPTHLVVAHGAEARLTDPALTPVAAAGAGRRDDASIPAPALPGDEPRTGVPAVPSEEALRAGAVVLVTRLLAEVLQYRPDAIDPTANLVEYGIDSLAILDMTARLEGLFGTLSKTLFFEYLNVTDVAGYFAEAHRDRLVSLLAEQDTERAPEQDAEQAPEPTAPATATKPATGTATPVAAAPATGPAAITVTEPAKPSAEADGSRDIAIVGISGRYPGAATMDELWQLLRDGRHSFEEVPRERWDHDAIYSRDRAEPGKSVIRTGTFLRDIDKFDPRYFHISKRDAEQMSPEVRLFLQLGVEALEDAGYSREQIQRQYQGDVAVLTGTMSNHYGLYGFQNSLVRGAPQSGSYNATMPNMLSYFYGLTGPSLFVDTMCSTSSTCVHQAVQMLRAGESRMVVAGGVNLLLHPYNLITSSQEHFTTATSDVIRSYGLGVDGTILGEGAGVVVLKTLADAERDGDHIHAVIKGTAITNAGTRNGFTVPSMAMQTSAVRKALDDAGVDARTISYVEGHGSGTSLGDPIEVKALGDAFRASTADTGFCALGSVKSNMGHLLAAAGVAGITKVVLQMREGQLAPSLHSDETNPDIPFGDTPFHVQRRLTDWRRPTTLVAGGLVEHPRRAGVTSIGAGGMNSHLVLEEYTPAPVPAHDGGHELFVFSAMTDEALESYLLRFRDFVATRSDDDLPAIAFTLRVGKNELPRRWAFLAKDRQGVLAAVERYLAGDRDTAAALAGDGPQAEQARETALDWTRGHKTDWSVLDGDRRPRRLPLPAYPFARVSCWVEEDPAAPSVVAPLVFRRALHPFLGENESDLGGLRYGTDLRLDDLLDYGHLRDKRRAVVPTFAVDSALACARVSGFAAGARIRDLRTVGRVDWEKASRLVTTFAAAEGRGYGTVFTQDDTGARTAIAEFTAHAGDDAGTADRWAGTAPGAGDLSREAVAVLTQEQFLAELAEGGIERQPMSEGVRAAYWLPDGCLALDVTQPDFQQNHVKRNVSIEPAVLAAVAHGAQLVAKRAGTARWASLIPHRIGEAAVAHPPIADVARVVLDLLPGDGGLGGRVLLLSGAGRLVGELTDVWWGDEDADLPGRRTERRTIPYSSAPPRTSVSVPVSAPSPAPAGASASLVEATAATAATEAAASGAGAVGFAAGELRVIAAGILGFEPEEIEPTTGFYAFGFDSISLVTLAGRVSERFGVQVSPALFFELDTLDALARHLVAEFGDRIPTNRPRPPAPPAAPTTGTAPPHPVGGQEQTADATTAAPERSPEARRAAPAPVTGATGPRDTADGSPMPVAVVGAAGRFPGARNLDEYWANLVAGVDSVGTFPLHRYDDTYRAIAEDADFPHHAGVLEDVDAFDAGFFRIYPREAELLDPQHRLALETVWNALEDSAYRPVDLPVDTGVFLGVSGTDYATLLSAHGIEPDAFTATGNAHSMLANRLSYVLDVRGPSEPVDTACSSSLVAVHRALEAIRSGACRMAVAGGVNLLLSTDTFVSAHKAGMLSPDGRCKTFSSEANGYVRGEGVAAVVLKPLADAERDGDAILGVLLGSAENHGGRAHSLTAPNADAQADLVAAAVGGTDPDTIGYIETHGTGTALGDPVEVRSLRSAFRRLGASGDGACGLGSVKSNIGHLEAAAGMAGLLKVLLAMRHGVLPATLHCGEINPFIELDGGPFHIVRENEIWQRPTGRDGAAAPRRAGVSSFGFGGSNCHLVVEEYPDPDTGRADQGPAAGAVVVPLSARTEDRLRAIARNLPARLRDERHTPLPLTALAWTLQAGREAMAERVGWVVESHERLAQALDAFVTDGHVVEGGARGSVELPADGGARRHAGAGASATPATERTAGYDDLRQVLLDWTRGADPDWRTLHGARTPKRAHLPGYPFARDRHWIPGHPPRRISAPAAGRAPAVPTTSDAGSGTPAMSTQAMETTLLVPRWTPRPRTAAECATAPARRLVILLEEAQAARDALVQDPDVRCVTVSSPKERLDGWFRDVTRQCLGAVREAAADERPGRTLVQAVVPAAGRGATAFALAGFMRTAMLEASHLTCQVIGFDEPGKGGALGAVLAAEAGVGDDLVLHRDGERLVRTWEVARAAQPTADGPLRPDGVYLITGGTGGVGSVVARWIAERAERSTVVLAGRSPRSAATDALLDGLRAAGATVRHARADISRWEETRRLVAGVRAEFGRIDGVFHAAGVLRDSALTTKTDQEWEDVLEPKSDGLVNLDHALGDAPLDFLITFSSGAAVTGNPGQCDYATANAFLDEFAELRNARVAAGERQGRTLSVAWPLWADGGMPVSSAALAHLWRSRGLAPMPAADGIAALSRAWQLGEDRVWVHHGRPSPPPATPGQEAAGTAPTASRERDAADGLRHLVTLFARVTKTAVDTIDVDRPLGETGLDSIMVVQLNRELAPAFGDVPKTLFYDLPTLRKIAERLASLGADAARPTEPAPGPAAPERRSAAASVPLVREPIAVIGMSGRYPQADNLDAFWTNLREGRDCIREVPADRWPLTGFYEPDRRKAVASGLSYSKWGGFLDDHAAFDPLFFQIAPRDAYVMDPQERLFLQAAHEVMEDAGYTRETLSRRHGRRVGVFAGVTKSGHIRHGAARLPSGETVVPALSFASLSSRTSYQLDLNGPSMTIDTMCSASLTAVHEACENIHRGACDMAIAGGVNLYLHPLDYIELCHSGMLSQDRHCRSFGSGGHGFVPGEGVGCVLLKPLSMAEADGDRILAVIRGTSVNHGGRSNGYTVPRSGAQAELIREALDRAGVSARDIGYVEAHGTGTELGDPIEIQGLTTAFEQDTADKQFCAIGSAKSAIGHLEAAAGIAGLTKAVLQLRHRQFAPTLHTGELNPNIAFDRTPFFVQREAAPWHFDGRPRITSVSSFGAGGANAHVIVEEYTPPQTEEHLPAMTQVSANGSEQLVVLSARTSGQLTAVAARLAEHVARTDADLADLAYSLQTGREPMSERLAVVVASKGELLDALDDFLTGAGPDHDGAVLHRGTTTGGAAGLLAELADDDVRELLAERWARSGKLTKLAAVWVQGLDADWRLLHEGSVRRRVALPTYPFAKDRYWIGDLAPVSAESGGAGPAAHAQEPVAAPVAPAGRPTAETEAETEGTRSPVAGLRAERAGESPSAPETRPPAPARVAPRSARTAAPAALDTEVPRVVRAVLARALAMPDTDIADTSAFADYGLDSILAVRVAHELGEALSLDLDTGVLFDHSSARRLSDHLLTAHRDSIVLPRPAEDCELPAAEAPVTARPQATATDRGTSPSQAHEGHEAQQAHTTEAPAPYPAPASRSVARPPVAVIGMSGRFAGSDSLDALWEHLADGDDLITPATRWDTAASGDATIAPRGGFLDRIDEFDSLFFNISGVEARGMDPQQRLLLEETWKALEDAGYPARAMDERRCGVYVGCWAGDYPGGEGESAPVQGLWGTMGSVIPGRISYFLNLRGPALAVDTSCSSSLVAIDLACKDLWSGETSMALAGGVFVQSTPRLYDLAGRAGMLSPSGRCHTFDDRADGFVPGEGVGVLVLKRLDDALADGDHIHGVIRGSGINHDGATNGLTAPSSLSQERLLREVYDTFGVDARRIGMVEAHGTGTRLGDPIEFGALTRAFRVGTDDTEFCALGSVKTNLGHTQFAAGIAGVLKVLLAFRHRSIPASLHFESPNKAIDLGNSPFYVNTRTLPWETPAGVPRRGVVSAFGASGTNAHLVLEEAPRPTRALREPRPAHLVVLSAHSREQLTEQVRRLAAHCRAHPHQDTGDIAWTLMAGREHFRYRFACVVRDHDDLLRVLDAGTGGPRAVIGDAGAGRAAEAAGGTEQESPRRLAGPVDPHTLRAELEALADLFAGGAELDYEAAFAPGSHRRVPLPTYPFARVRHWAGAELPAGTPAASGDTAQDAAAPSGTGRAPAATDGQRTRLTLGDFRRFLDDHVVQGRHVLPGVVYLEMAREAAARFLGADPDAAVRLRNVTWVRPISAEGTQADQVDQAMGDIELWVRRAPGGAAFEFRSAGAEDAVFCEGRATSTGASRPPRTDLPGLRRDCATTVAGERVHEALVERGIDHGPALRALHEAHVGPGTVLAELRTPDAAPAPAVPFLLHPSLLDSAIQASAALNMAGDGMPQGTAVPFALEQLDVFAECAPAMWAVVRTADDPAVDSPLSRLDIDLVDDAGEVCVRMTGYTARQVTQAPPSLFAPVWDALPAQDLTASSPEHDDHVLVVGGDAEQLSRITGRCARTTAWHLPPTASVDEVAGALRAMDPVDHLVWAAPKTAPAAMDAAGLLGAQTDGVYAAFRMIKGLLRAEYDRRPLGITLVTRWALATHPAEPASPAHAGLHGLFGSLAQEYPNWTVRRADLADDPWPEDLVALPVPDRADSWVHRGGQWLTRRWAPCDVEGTRPAGYREGGVYVVIGGAGGLGAAWTRHVVEHFGAHVVWIGRSPRDASVDAALASVRGRGSVHYVRGDASDRASLQDAYDRVSAEFPRVHGVVHAALVLRDQSFATMDEETMRASLAAKVDAVVTTAEVFGAEDLDFALFFSSVQSFATTAGQGNYAAGSAFLDAYARLLDRHWNCPVKVMNWGWWGSQGSVSSAYYRRRMRQAGLVSIEAPEAMAALDVLLGGPYGQMAFVKLTGTDALTAAEPSVRAALRPPAAERVPVHALTGHGTPRAEREVLGSVAAWRENERDPMLGRVLRAHLVALGALDPEERVRGDVSATAAEADAGVRCRRAGILERYRPWLRQALRVVPDTAPPLRTVEREWDERRRAWSSDAGVKAELELVDATLRELPGILTGVRRPTDVMFPRGSFGLVEGCYRDNPVADAYNRAVQDTVVRLVTEWLSQDRGAKIRILEIGAGTGGTSVGLFRALKPFEDSIETYLYTDLSKAFLNNARATHGPHVPYLDCAQFDVERPLAGQGIEEGGFDIVVAANVLHATANIRRTLRNAKAALRDGGWLVLNELSQFDVFSHLTFGLLEGWWLSEDTALRIPGSPALSPDGWREVLRGEGFATVASVLPQAAELGQQIIAAESDGTARQTVPGRTPRPHVAPASSSGAVTVSPTDTATPADVPDPAATPRTVVIPGNAAPGEAPPPQTPPTVPAERVPAGREPARRVQAEPDPAGPKTAEALTRHLSAMAAQVLGIPAERIDPAVPLTSYGLDSLLVLQLTHLIRADLGDDVSSTLLFEVESVDGLVAHFLARRADAVDALVAPQAAAGSGERWPLSRSQSRLWHGHTGQPDAPTYNTPLLFEIHGAFDEKALEQACRTQPRRHPMLAAVFRKEDGVPQMEIDRTREMSFETVLVTAASRDEQLDELRELVNRPFDLEAGPLARAHRVTLDSGSGAPRHLLLVTVHHVVMDGTSAALLVQSLKDAYTAALHAQEPPAPDPDETTFADFVAWEAALLNSPKAERHRAYWLSELRGARGDLALPRDHRDTAGLAPRTSFVLVKLTPDVTDAFVARARAHQSSVATLFLATYTVYLHALTGQSDLVVGFTTAARYEERFKNVIGQFINFLPIRSTLSGEEDFSAFVSRAGRAVVQGIDHGAYPLLEIERALSEEESRPVTPLLTTNLIFQNFNGASVFTGAGGAEAGGAEAGGAEAGPLDLRPFDDLPDCGEMPVTIEIYQGPDGYKLFFKYDAHAFEASTAQSMADELGRVIEHVAHTADFRIGDQPWRHADHAPVDADADAAAADEPREGDEHA